MIAVEKLIIKNYKCFRDFENMHIEKCFHKGNYASAIENGQIVRPKRPERDIKTEI